MSYRLIIKCFRGDKAALTVERMAQGTVCEYNTLDEAGTAVHQFLELCEAIKPKRFTIVGVILIMNTATGEIHSPNPIKLEP